MGLLIRTEDLPPAERFPFWRDMICQTMAPYDIRTDHVDDFRAQLHVAELGAVDLGLMIQPSLQAHRTRQHIRRSDPEHYTLGLLVRGQVNMAQDHRDTTLGPGNFVLHSTSRPLRTSTETGTTGWTGLLISFPHTLLPLPDRKIAQLTAARLPAQNGLGRLMARQLHELADGVGTYTAADAARVGMVTVDLLSALLAHELEAGAALPPETHQATLIARIHAFIDENLGDPGLTPQAVADAHHLSVRSLHRLFRTCDGSVAAWIRSRRLERCRRDLTDPGLLHQSIQTIAVRRGFTNTAHFSRIFHTAYGLSPRDYRRQAATRKPQW
ncbi:helix-turn-helix domain-containing protein [Streptomyces sp. NPDC050617]|uniref:AraC-like ligand-binding domain-containing protein n=1 Tax=Streptomyces sp. NPDC050617 TaxID=3154628 RepID=UPI003411FFC1